MAEKLELLHTEISSLSNQRYKLFFPASGNYEPTEAHQ